MGTAGAHRHAGRARLTGPLHSPQLAYRRRGDVRKTAVSFRLKRHQAMCLPPSKSQKSFGLLCPPGLNRDLLLVEVIEDVAASSHWSQKPVALRGISHCPLYPEPTFLRSIDAVAST